MTTDEHEVERKPTRDNLPSEEQLLVSIYETVDACAEVVKAHAALSGNPCDCDMCTNVDLFQRFMEMFENLIENDMKPCRAMLQRWGRSDADIARIEAGWAARDKAAAAAAAVPVQADNPFYSQRRGRTG